MYRRFRFEGDIHATLDCVPLTVRRKLDLAGLKISLEGWQALPFAERLALCHLPVDTDADLIAYRDVMRGFCEQAGVPLKPLENVDPRLWRGSTVPSIVRGRLDANRLQLSDEDWRELDEETRYSLVKLADPKRNPAKLPWLMAELGLAPEPSEPIRSTRNVCEPAPLQ
jgi:hypothetical protein